MSDTTIPTPADIAPKASDPAVNDAPEPEVLPPDHPLVKTLAAMKDEVKSLKAKASRLDEIEEASKTAEQKAAERLAEAEQRAAELEAKATVAEIAAEKNVPADILAGPRDRSREAVQEFADLVLAHVTDRAKSDMQRNNVVPREGANPTSKPPSTADLFAAALTGRI